MLKTFYLYRKIKFYQIFFRIVLKNIQIFIREKLNLYKIILYIEK
jgi:hypothetical protein